MKKLVAKIDGREFVDNADIIDTILNERQIDNLENFLSPTIDALNSPTNLLNITKAFQIVDNAINKRLKITILADTDCDGICSGAILYRYLNKFTNNIDITINEGKLHGIEKLETNCDVLLVVDSINKPEEYRRFTNHNVQIVVLDHHILLDTPDAYSHITLVSSANNYPNPELSGAGVVWQFCRYLDDMWLVDYSEELTDLAACALIADMVDLSVPENRYICYYGLKHLKNIGIKAILGSYNFDSQAVTFSIASLINACQRMNQNKVALQLFITDLPDKAKVIVDKMKEIKEQQNELVEKLMPELVKSAQPQLDNKCMSFTIDTEYGISGLLANKLMDMYQRPVLVLKHLNGQYAGSMRACGVDNFLAMINDTGLAECEGHELAAGFFCDEDDYHEFMCEINNRLMNVEFEERCVADVELGLWQINQPLIESFKAINFVSGKGFKPLTVLVRDIDNYEVGSMSKGKHLKIVTDECLIIKWNCKDFDKFQGQPFSVVGGLAYGRFGRTAYMQIIANEFDVGE